MRGLLLLGFLGLVGCASVDFVSPSASDILMPAEKAVQLWRNGAFKLIDTRSPNERSSGQIVDALLIQFGPDRWMDGIAEEDTKTFLLLVAAAGLGHGDSVVTVCNVGVRSLAAARALRSAGFERVHSVTGGFVGKGAVPGWQFYQ